MMTLQQFEDKYIPEPNSGCWIWMGPLFPAGYGRLSVANHDASHRLSWVLHHGSIPAQINGKRACVLHHCDNRTCVNPDHLFLGTHSDNTKDCVKKGRFNKSKGEQRHNAKLTEQDVREIRASPLDTVQLAEIYHVSRTQIGQIKRRVWWKHVV